MTTKHTPGPWRAIIGMTLGDDEQRARTVAHLACEFQVFADAHVKSDEVPANTHLIAAAPDLLAACQSALRQLDYGDIAAAGPILRAAIAKATA